MLTAKWDVDVTMLVQVKWITFHSGYDFGYLLKVLTCQPLPKTEVDFFELLKVKHCPVSCCAGLVSQWRHIVRLYTHVCWLGLYGDGQSDCKPPSFQRTAMPCPSSTACCQHMPHSCVLCCICRSTFLPCMISSI